MTQSLLCTGMWLLGFLGGGVGWCRLYPRKATKDNPEISVGDSGVFFAERCNSILGGTKSLVLKEWYVLFQFSFLFPSLLINSPSTSHLHTNPRNGILL